MWLQGRLTPDEADITVEGTHDIDFQWMMDVRDVNPNIKFVPRIIFERWTHSQYLKLLTHESLVSNIASQLVRLARKYEFDGYVVEIWRAFSGQHRLYVYSCPIH